MLIKEEPPDWSSYNRCRVRAISLHKKTWSVDPDPSTLDPLTSIWIHENTPFHRVSWDHGELAWNEPHKTHNNFIPFLQFSAKLGRQILQQLEDRPATTTKRWTIQHISAPFIRQFWARLWHMKHPRKFITFQWLITHNSVPVGAWCEVMGHPSTCNICHNEQETQAHALWSCDAAHQIWGRILRLITKIFP